MSKDSVGSRIRDARKARGFTARQVAEKIGVDPASMSRWERDDQGLTLENAAALSVVLDVTIDYLYNGSTVIPMGTAANTEAFPVVGVLQAGAWLEGEQWTPDDDLVATFSVKPEWRGLVKQAYVLRGDSMNKWMPSGSYVLVASTIANGIEPRSGQKVLVNRRSRDGLHEATIKELEMTPDGKMWLWPRSTSPEFQAPIAYEDDNTEEVTITGVVISAQWNEAL